MKTIVFPAFLMSSSTCSSRAPSKRPVGEIARETQALGGYLNAYTYYDRTVYHTEVPAENMKKALDIQADALWNSTYDAGRIEERNRSRLAGEQPQAGQSTGRGFRKTLCDRIPATPDDAVAHRYAGRLARADTRRHRGYVKKYYRPSNIILSIAGQLDIEQTIAEVVKLYGNIPADDAPIDRDAGPVEAEQTDVRYDWQRGPIEQNHVAFGFHTPGVLATDARALEVLAAILGEGRASVLTQYLRDEKGLITSGSAGLVAFRDLGFFEMDLETARPLEAQDGAPR